MKHERLLLTVLGAIFAIELLIAIPALWSQHVADRDEASSTRLIAVTPLRKALPTDASGQPTPASTASTASPLASRPKAATPPVPISSVPEVTDRSGAVMAKAVALAVRERQQRVAVVDDIPQPDATASFDYTGHWEHVRAIEDGRTAGTSSRSFRAGSRATFTFTGTEVRLFGVCGPSGGRAVVTLDGRRAETLTDFYAAEKEAHMLVYASPRLHWGQHKLSISVLPAAVATKANYVNIDGAEYD